MSNDFDSWYKPANEDNVSQGSLLADVPEKEGIEISYGDHYTDAITAAGNVDDLLGHVHDTCHELLESCGVTDYDPNVMAEEVSLEGRTLASLGYSEEGVVSRFLAKHDSTVSAINRAPIQWVGALTLNPILFFGAKGMHALDLKIGGWITRALINVSDDAAALAKEATAVKTKAQSAHGSDQTIISAQGSVLKVGGEFPTGQQIVATAAYLERLAQTMFASNGNNIAMKYVPKLNKAITDVAAGKAVNIKQLQAEITAAFESNVHNYVSKLGLGSASGESMELCGGWGVSLQRTTVQGYSVAYPEFDVHTATKNKYSINNIVVCPQPQLLAQAAQHLAKVGEILANVKHDMDKLEALIADSQAKLLDAGHKLGEKGNREQAKAIATLTAMNLSMLSGNTKSDMHACKYILLISFRILTFLNRCANKYT